MKTFSEACESTFMRTVPIGSTEPTAVMAEIDGRLAPFISMVEEIQNAPETHALACSLLELMKGEDIHFGDLLKIAFSHGVMVGVEMEKP